MQAQNAVLDEDDVTAGGSDQSDAYSVTKTIDFDTGGARYADFKLEVPADLKAMHLTSDGVELKYSVTNNGNTLVAKAGTEEVFSIKLTESGGNASYTYTLKGHIDHDPGQGEQVETLPVGLMMKTSTGDVIRETFTVGVVDDRPEAENDLDTVASRLGATTTGNVLTGIDADASTGAHLVADENGADSAAVSAVRSGDTVVSFDDASAVHVDAKGNHYVDVQGEHGSLRIFDNGSYTYKVTDAQAGQSETVTIDNSNYRASDHGFQVSAKSLDAQGNYVDGQVNHYDGGWGTGFGVDGNKGGVKIGVDEETGYVPAYGKSEQLIIDFDKDVSTAKVTLDTFFDTSVDARVEVGKITALKDGQEVGSMTFSGKDASGDLVVSVDFDKNFDQLVLEGSPYKGGQGGITTDSSDFLVRGVTFTTVPAPVEEHFEYTIRDHDGDIAKAMLDINVASPAGRDLGVTLGDDQGLHACQDEFTFGHGVSGGGDGWTQLVLDDTLGQGAAEGWGNYNETVEIQDHGADKGGCGQDQGENNHNIDQNDSIGW
ncbi:hypothetical protein MTBUT4_310002 [Magnetospirillum sp. UT-4]|nr:hypothetical protein MTBUT4_310002 [Magnetospirillum sp. UT-4]